MIRLVQLALPLAIVAGCGEPPPVANPSPFDEDDPAAQIEATDDDTPDLPVVVAAGSTVEEPEPAAARPELIDKAALHEVLAAGPGAYAGSVMIEAVVDNGDLRGWKLTRWDVPWAGLAVGEVVVDVNGVAIVRPDDLMDLWESLWEADEIAIRLRGDGADEIRRFSVR